MSTPVVLSWSSGKDSAWALYQLQEDEDIEVVALLTTYNQQFNRVAMHGVRHQLLMAQAEKLKLPMIDVALPWPCTNQAYEQAMHTALQRAQKQYNVSNIAFGDLFLEDVKNYRIELLQQTDWQALFPIWQRASEDLARQIIDSGFQSYITCVDPKQLDPGFAGRAFDQSLLNDLPSHVDPCGENGEFHTFVHAGPVFDSPLSVTVGEIVQRDGFVFADLLAA